MDASIALRGASADEVASLRHELQESNKVQGEQCTARQAAEQAAERSHRELTLARERAHKERTVWATERAELRSAISASAEQAETRRRDSAHEVSTIRESVTRLGFELETAREGARRDQREWANEKSAFQAAMARAETRADGLARELQERAPSADSVESLTRRHTELLGALRAELGEAHTAAATATEAGLADRKALESLRVKAASERAESERALEGAKAVVRQWTVKCKNLKTEHAAAQAAQSASTCALEEQVAAGSVKLATSEAAATKEADRLRVQIQQAETAAVVAAAKAEECAAGLREELAAVKAQLQGDVAAARRAAAKERLTRTVSFMPYGL